MAIIIQDALYKKDTSAAENVRKINMIVPQTEAAALSEMMCWTPGDVLLYLQAYCQNADGVVLIDDVIGPALYAGINHISTGSQGGFSVWFSSTNSILNWDVILDIAELCSVYDEQAHTFRLTILTAEEAGISIVRKYSPKGKVKKNQFEVVQSHQGVEMHAT